MRRLVFFLAALAVASVAVYMVAGPSSDDGTRNEDSPETAASDTENDIEPDPSTTGTAAAAEPDAEPGDSEIGSPDSATPLTSPAPPPAALRARASRLADGDSFDVEWIDRPPSEIRRDEVRMLGINAPERDACFGAEARDVLEDLIDGRDILVEIVETEDDGFGRQIANVWVGDELLNLRMVELGAALALSDGGPHARLIGAAQDDASESGRGLWTACGALADVAIIDLQFDAPGRDDFNPNGEWIEIANFGEATIDLTGWGIRDESTRHRYFFPDGFSLAPSEVVRIGSGCDFDDDADRVDLTWCASDPVWNNGGDTAFLVDADGRFVDEWGYDG